MQRSEQGSHVFSDLFQNKDIDADTEWSIDGLTITANGTITLYNLNGVKVAAENDILQAPAAGIYIMDINGKRTKINIR